MPHEFTSLEEKRIRLYFRISILFKGAISVAEIIAGIAFFFIPVTYLSSLVTQYAQTELLNEPGDFIATHILSIAHDFALTSGTFIAFYLLSRGLVKVVLIAALLKNKLWAYPASLAVLGLFVAYQLYQIYTGFSVPLVALTIFDFIVMYFIWREYQVLKFEA
jgi:uncharacterized membrane protein